MVLNALTKVSLFQSLSEDELEGLAASLQVVNLRAGQVLFRQGDAGDHFYVIQAGQVEIIKEMGTPAERRLALRGPGEFFGEMSLFRLDMQRTASVRAFEAVRLLEMSRSDFDRLLTLHPKLGYAMVQVLSTRLNDSHNHAINDLKEKNRQLMLANEELKAAQAQLIEKERLERELQLAKEIQLSILPQVLPQLKGYDFGARLVSARAVGGDFYDVIPLGKDRVGLVIGDVTDKGVPASIFMAQTHALLRAFASPRSRPAETLLKVNEQLLEMNASSLFVTVIYGILEIKTGLFTYARAGHEMPLFFQGGAFQPPVFKMGQALGVLDRPVLDEQTISLLPGGTALLFTDGVSDAVDPLNQAFGKDRLQAAFCSAAGLSGAEVCDEVFQAVNAHQAGASQFDDITLVAIRRWET